MRMPLAATRGAPTKDDTPAPPATASVSFTLHSHVHSFFQHESVPPMGCHWASAEYRVSCQWDNENASAAIAVPCTS